MSVTTPIALRKGSYHIPPFPSVQRLRGLVVDGGHGIRLPRVPSSCRASPLLL